MRVQLNNNRYNSEFMSRIFVFFVFIFSLQYALYVVSGSFFDVLIKLSSFTLLMLFVLKPGNRINGVELILVLMYFLIFISVLIPTIFSGERVMYFIKIFLMSLILPILLACYRSLPRCDDFLISTYIVIGVLFSVQAFLAFIGVFTGGMFDQSQITILEKYGNMKSIDFGIFGLGNAIQSPFLDYKILRPQGWFIEPSKLAAFLLLPAFVSIGRYRIYRKKKYILSAVIIFLAILLTQSLAGYLAVACATLLLVFSKPFYRAIKKIPVLKYSYIILIFLIFFGFAYSVVNLTHLADKVDPNSVSEGQALLTTLMGRDAAGPSGNLLREVYKIDNYLNLVQNSPFGLGFIGTTFSEFKSGNALLYWLVAGGILAVLIIIMMFTYIFIVFCHPLLISGNVVFNALGASFIGHAIQNLSYGRLIAPYFLIHLALVVMSSKKLRKSSSVKV